MPIPAIRAKTTKATATKTTTCPSSFRLKTCILTPHNSPSFPAEEATARSRAVTDVKPPTRIKKIGWAWAAITSTYSISLTNGSLAEGLLIGTVVPVLPLANLFPAVLFSAATGASAEEVGTTTRPSSALPNCLNRRTANNFLTVTPRVRDASEYVDSSTLP
jgi:hypothetical protein